MQVLQALRDILLVLAATGRTTYFGVVCAFYHDLVRLKAVRSKGAKQLVRQLGHQVGVYIEKMHALLAKFRSPNRPTSVKEANNLIYNLSDTLEACDYVRHSYGSEQQPEDGGHNRTFSHRKLLRRVPPEDLVPYATVLRDVFSAAR
jgi:hypothetical protein